MGQGIEIRRAVAVPALTKHLCGIQGENDDNGEDGDDGDDNEELDEGETSSTGIHKRIISFPKHY
jgi:hypothetical protein